MSQGKCFLCLEECQTRCDQCKEVWFCCKEHEELHRPLDKSNGDCYPYKVSYADGIGRCLVATKTIEPGELIFRENPLAIGPLHDTQAVCLGCLKKVDGKFKCSSCSLPMCDEICMNSVHHQEAECPILSRLKAKVSIDFFDREHPFYQCVAPLRCLALKSKEPHSWRAMQSMMDHVSDKPRDQTWKILQNNVVRFLIDRCKMPITDEEVNHVIGLLDVNAFEVKGQKSSRVSTSSDDENSSTQIIPDEHIHEDTHGGVGRGVYPLTALMSHSCVSNARYIIREENVCECRANVRIEEGEEITDFYVSPLHGTHFRRRSLRDGWFFLCQCKRCKDPTEFNTFMDALKCTECSGPLVSVDPLRFDADVICCNCKATFDGKSMNEMEDKFAEILESAKKTDQALQENLLNMASETFYSTHYLVATIKRHLIYIYGRVPGKLLSDLPSELVERKKLYCEELLRIYDVIMPGLTKERGLTIYELVSVILFNVKKVISDITDHSHRLDVVREVKRCYNMLEETIKCLQYERRGTFEHLVLTAARRQIRECKELSEILSLIPIQHLKITSI